MLKNIKAVIFDLDGTLIDSMWLWKAIDIDYLAKHGYELPEDLQDQIEGMSFTETAYYFKNRFNIADEVEDIKSEWNELAGEYYHHKVTVKPNVSEFLKALKQSNIKMGIGSSNSKELIQMMIDKFEWHDYFDSVRSSCEVAKGKPSPDIYLKVAQDICVEPAFCLVFEDVISGIQAGKAAGMQVCAVYDEASVHQDEQKKLLADYYIDGFHELSNWIKEDTYE